MFSKLQENYAVTNRMFSSLFLSFLVVSLQFSQWTWMLNTEILSFLGERKTYRVDLLRQTPLEISQMSWCNTLQLLTMVKAQHNSLVRVNCWPLSYLKAEKIRSDCPCQKRHNTSHPKQNFWPFRLKFWYVVLYMEPYKNYFLAVPWERYWTPALTLTWLREGQKVWKWFQRHIWDRNFVILKS